MQGKAAVRLSPHSTIQAYAFSLQDRVMAQEGCRDFHSQTCISDGREELVGMAKVVSQVFVSILKSFSGSPVNQFPFTYLMTYSCL